MKIKAQHDRVIMKPITENESSYGSIIIPDLGKERPVKGQVVSVGPGRTTEYGQLLFKQEHVNGWQSEVHEQPHSKLSLKYDSTPGPGILVFI